MTPEELDLAPPEVHDELIDQDKIIFRPNPGPQTAFLAANDNEVFYGGARGGGKSYALLVDCLRNCHKTAHRALIIRRTMPELRDMIAKTHLLYPRAYPGAKWREQDKVWTFPSGARIEFGYCENMQDAQRYLGQSYTWIGVDELPQFATPEIWNFLRSSLRSVDPSIKTHMRATGNPGNVGSGWIKDMFISPAPPNTRFVTIVKFMSPFGAREVQISRRYIPATVWDNPYLTYDDTYVAMLASLPEMQRRQFLEGDWDAFDGAAFPEFRKEHHVVEPFEIPGGWTRFRAADWGYSSPACCLWFAVDPDQDLWVYRELYGGGNIAEDWASKILHLEWGEPISYGVLDASTWSNRGESGPSIAEVMIRNGCRWRQSDRSPRSRKSGKLQVHQRLKLKPYPSSEGLITERPSLHIFSSCVQLIRTLPALPLDKTDQEDVDTDAEDHAYDALRYGCSSRPLNPNGHGYLRDLTRPRQRAADPTFGY